VSGSPSPYRDLPPDRFWRTGVAAQDPRTITGLYAKRFAIDAKTKVATAGSCFAQHIARYLRENGFSVLDVEPPPRGLGGDEAKRFGYQLYSARYGNIYLARQLRQLIDEAYGRHQPSDAIWEREGRFYDALRPSVEPIGLRSPEEVRAHRERHLAAVRRMVESMDLFVFTFGLTEGWVHVPSGTVYPTAPGTIAGMFDPSVHAFKNFGFTEILYDFLAVREALLAVNPRLRFLVTVSPVPLTATASGKHVLQATVYSKSVLRAVAGELYESLPDLDYFPSYELVASHFSRGEFFEDNLRSVAPDGVSSVMRVFFAEHEPVETEPDAAGAIAPAAQETAPQRIAAGPAEAATTQAETDTDAEDAVVCEDELLDAFAQ
jgi:hypothetical protein